MTPSGASRENPTAPDTRDPWDALAARPSDLPEADLEPDPGAVDEVESEEEQVDADPTEPEPVEEIEEEAAARGSGYTIPMLCAGTALIACCLLIPLADANRRMAYEREKLRLDLESVRKQVAVNDEFLKRVADDSNLAERLAQRQMKIIREGTKVLKLKGESDGGAGMAEMSPFHLVAVSPPAELPPYKPIGGPFASLFYQPRKRLYLLGGGLMLLAAGLVMGVARR